MCPHPSFANRGSNTPIHRTGNITRREVYPHSTGTLDPANRIEDVAYTYGDTQWGDLLTAYNGVTITHDAIGNTLNDGTWTYTWQHGRELASMTKTNGETWTFTYNADGLRTKRTAGGRTYQYTYVGSQLTNMTVDGHNINIFYDTNGSPVMMNMDGYFYYYVTNLQGDVAQGTVLCVKTIAHRTPDAAEPRAKWMKICYTGVPLHSTGDSTGDG